MANLVHPNILTTRGVRLTILGLSEEAGQIGYDSPEAAIRATWEAIREGEPMWIEFPSDTPGRKFREWCSPNPDQVVSVHCQPFD